MSKCSYCGQEAGFLQGKHKACEERHSQGLGRVLELAKSGIKNGAELETLHESTRSVSGATFVTEGERIDSLVQAFDDAVTQALEDGLLTSQEEQGLIEYGKRLSLSQDDLDKRGGYTKLIQGGVLRELAEGRIPERVALKGELPFNLQKGEKIAWLFNDVKYHEVRTRTHFEGRSSGVSVRVARGLYYRTGTFKGHPVKTEETVLVGKGVMLITSKNIYFGSSAKSLRIPYGKIVAFTPYSDGVGIQRDALSAKPQLFINGAGWFTYNLLMNLSQSQGGAA